MQRGSCRNLSQTRGDPALVKRGERRGGDSGKRGETVLRLREPSDGILPGISTPREKKKKKADLKNKKENETW